MTDIGSSITQSVAFLARVYTESINLSNLLKQEISAALLDAELGRMYKAAGPWVETYQEDPSGCMYYSFGGSLPLARRPKHKPGSHLFFQISLAGEGIAASGCSEPLLHMGLWDDPISFPQGYYMGFPLSGEAPVLEDGILMRWPGVSPQGLWLYSQRLSAINTTDDIRRKVVQPIRSLLLGETAAVALTESLAGIASYTALGEPEGGFAISFIEPGQRSA